MADKEEKPQEQPKGGDHIPTDTAEEEEDTQPKGLLSKIGDPVGMSLSLSFPISLHSSLPQPTARHPTDISPPQETF